MAISPQTLREVEFRASLRGYHPDDVDEFLERLAAGIEILHDRLREASERAVRAEQALGRADHDAQDEHMREMLVESQGIADSLLRAARAEAEHTRGNARAYAEALRSEAEQVVQRTRSEARAAVEADLRRLEARRQRAHLLVTAFERWVVAERAGLSPGHPRWPQCLHLYGLDAADA